MTLNSEVGLRNTKVQNGSIKVNIALWNNFTHYLAPLFCLFLKKIMFLLQNDIFFTILQVPFVRTSSIYSFKKSDHEFLPVFLTIEK